MKESLATVRQWKSGSDLDAVIDRLMNHGQPFPPRRWNTAFGVNLICDELFGLGYALSIDWIDGTVTYRARFDHDTYPDGEGIASSMTEAVLLAFLDTHDLNVDYEEDTAFGEEIQRIANEYAQAQP